jgi:VanZ family protein
VACLGLIFLLSSVPGRSLGSPVPDYAAHPAEYFVLGTLLLRALNGGVRPAPRTARYLQMAMLCIGWGVLDETHQSFVPGREASPVDVAYDTGGAVLAALAFPLWRWLPLDEAPTRSPGAILFLERRECPLCAAAWIVLERLVAEHDVDCRRIDVDGRSDLAAAWGDEVPVVLLDGAAVCRGRVDERALRRRLAPFRRPSSRT